MTIDTNDSWQSVAVGPLGQIVVGGQVGPYPQEDVVIIQRP